MSRLKALRSSLFVKNISKVYCGDILSKAFTAGTILILVRGLQVEEYAVYTAFWSVLNLAPGLIGRGINQAQVRFSSE